MRSLMRTSAWIGCLLLLTGIAVQAAPVAAFTATRATGGSDTTVLLDASTSDDPTGTITTYQWLFGDGFTGSGVRVEHAYAQGGRYTVTLLVSGTGGSQMVTQEIDLSSLDEAPSGASPTPNPTPVATVPIAPRLDLPVGTKYGQRAPDFSLPTFSDEFVRLSDYLGQVVILEFWRSTCPSCQASTPHLDTLRAHFADSGVVVMLIVLDQKPADGWRYLSQGGFTEFVTVHEIDPNNRQTAYTYGVSGVPQAFVVDREGVIRFAGHPNGLTTDTIIPLL